MSKNVPEFRFEMWATHRPDDAYYVTNWDRKKKITVVAPTKQDAIDKARVALGSAGHHRYWTFRVTSVTDHRIPMEVNS